MSCVYVCFNATNSKITYLFLYNEIFFGAHNFHKKMQTNPTNPPKFPILAKARQGQVNILFLNLKENISFMSHECVLLG